MAVNKGITGKSDSPCNNQVEKYIKKGNAKKKFNESYEQDSDARYIKNSALSREDYENDYVCHEKFVVPRYLIQCVPQLD